MFTFLNEMYAQFLAYIESIRTRVYEFKIQHISGNKDNTFHS